MKTIAILGGTGAEGRGLATRLAAAGHDVRIGSRDTDRAQTTAEHLRRRLEGLTRVGRIEGFENDDAAQDAGVVVLSLPFAVLEARLAGWKDLLRDRIVIDVVNALTTERGLVQVLPVAQGSVSQLVQQAVPLARVVCAFKNLSATMLDDERRRLGGDVLVCGDDDDARNVVLGLAEGIPHLRAIDAGPLRQATHVEAITPLLLNLNRRFRTTTSLGIVGLEAGHLARHVPGGAGGHPGGPPLEEATSTAARRGSNRRRDRLVHPC